MEDYDQCFHCPECNGHTNMLSFGKIRKCVDCKLVFCLNKVTKKTLSCKRTAQNSVSSTVLALSFMTTLLFNDE